MFLQLNRSCLYYAPFQVSSVFYDRGQFRSLMNCSYRRGEQSRWALLYTEATAGPCGLYLYHQPSLAFNDNIRSEWVTEFAVSVLARKDIQRTP